MIFYRGISSDLSQVRAAFEMLWMSAMGLLKARIGQCLIICSIVWDEWPQSQAGESLNPHLYKLSPHLPWPVRSLFKVTHSRRLSEKPGTWEHGSLISWWLSGFDRFHFDLQSNWNLLFEECIIDKTFRQTYKHMYDKKHGS